MSINQNVHAENIFSLAPNGPYVFDEKSALGALRFKNSFEASHTLVWIPSPKDVEKLEEILSGYLEERKKEKKQHPPNQAYDRQYIGVFVEGRRLIYGNFYPAGKFQRQDKEFAVVKDGGASYWSVLYNSETSTFEDIDFNGEA